MTPVPKRLGTLVWALLECMFFSSIVLGWTWLAMVFRSDGYYPEKSCNITRINVTSFGHDDQYLLMGEVGQLPENEGRQGRPIKRPCRPRRKATRDDLDLGLEQRTDTVDILSSARFPDQQRHGQSKIHGNPQKSELTGIFSSSNSSHLPATNVATTTANNSSNSNSSNSSNNSNNNNTKETTHDNKPVTDVFHFHGPENRNVSPAYRTRPKSHIRSDTMHLRTITQPVINDVRLYKNVKTTTTSLNVNDKGNNNNHSNDKNNNYHSYRSAPISDNSYFEDIGHETIPKVVGYCYEQNELIRTMFAVVLILRDLLAFPMCFIYDKYGTTKTRLLTVLVFALGTLMMTFTSRDVPWLVIPALTITGLAGSAVLLTNLQTANLFGRKRHVVISLYVGAAYSNGIITLLMKLAHFNGVDVQTSFMLLTIAIVPVLVATVAFLPKTRIPWPLPADYGKRRNQSLDEAMLRKQRAWQRRMSEAGLVRSRRPAPQFGPVATQSLFVWSVLWFSCQRLQEAVFETHLVDIAPEKLEDDIDIDMETYYSSIQLLALILAPFAGFLIDRDPRPALGLTQATQQMQRIVPAIVTTSIFGLLEVATDMMSGPGARGITILFNILHKVFSYTTMCAFVMHIHFNHQNLGKLYGLTLSLSAVISAFQFPMRTYLIKKYDSMFPAHILLLILNLVALAHAINAWDHCRKRLIKDQSDNSSERFARLRQSGHTPTAIHIETDDRNLPGNHGDRLVVVDPNEASSTEVSGLVSSHIAPSEEKSTTAEVISLPSKNVDDTNGGSRIVFRDEEDDDDDDDEVYDDDDVIEDVNRGYNGLQTIDFV